MKRGLRMTHSTISDNLTPQETIEEDSGMIADDGASLCCAESSVVADQSTEAKE